MTNEDRLRLRPENSKVAARVDQALWHAMFLQDIECTIDRKSFGNAPEVDRDSPIAKPDPVSGQQFDRLVRPGARRLGWASTYRARQQSRLLQHRGYRNVEQARRAAIKLDC